MKNTTHRRSRWRIRALLCCASAWLLAGCGAGNQGSLSNGPQMAALVVSSAAPAVQSGSTEAAVLDPAPEAAAIALPAAPAPSPAAAEPEPATSAAASDLAPPANAASPAPAVAGGGAKGDAFAMSGYGVSEPAGSTDAGTAAAASDNAASMTVPAPAICKYGGCSFR